jgi:hypothetical protein
MTLRYRKPPGFRPSRVEDWNQRPAASTTDTDPYGWQAVAEAVMDPARKAARANQRKMPTLDELDART